MPDVPQPTPEYKVAKKAVENADKNKDKVIDAKEKQSIAKNIQLLRAITKGGDKLQQKALAKAFTHVLREYKGVSRKEVAQWIYPKQYKNLLRLTAIQPNENDDDEDDNDGPYKIKPNLDSIEWVGPIEDGETLEVPVAPFVDPDYVELPVAADSLTVHVDCGEGVDTINVYKLYDAGPGPNERVAVIPTNGLSELDIVIPHDAGISADYIITSENSAGESDDSADVAVDIEENIEEEPEVPPEISDLNIDCSSTGGFCASGGLDYPVIFTVTDATSCIANVQVISGSGTSGSTSSVALVDTSGSFTYTTGSTASNVIRITISAIGPDGTSNDYIDITLE